MNNKVIIQDISMNLQNINYGDVFFIGNSIVIFVASNMALKTYNLKREFNPKKVKIDFSPEIIQKYSDVNFDKILSMKYGNSLAFFAHILMNNFRDEDLALFKNNINELVINNKNFGLYNFLLGINVDGEYDCRKNEIGLNNKCDFLSIDHELFHMASSIYSNNIEYSGFRYYNRKTNDDFGRGLNEGYTQTLTERYFGSFYGDNIYIFEVHFARMTEEIIGKSKMESLYLNANLNGLIDELKKYESEENIMIYICHLDFINKYINDSNLFMMKKKFLAASIKYVGRFLLTCYTKKIGNEVKNNNCTMDEGIDYLMKYICKLGFCLEYGKYSFELLNKDDIKQIIKSNLDFDVNVDMVEDKKKLIIMR